MAFNNRAAVPLDYDTSPLLPQADSSQAHDIPTGISPTTSKLQDWIAWLSASRRRPPVYLTDASQTVDMSMGNVFVLATPAATRIITIRQSTAPVPTNGDWMRFYLKVGASPFFCTLRREGSVDDIAYVAGYFGSPDIFQGCFAEVQLASGVWRLVAASAGVDASTDA
jgi:hypothetical protein